MFCSRVRKFRGRSHNKLISCHLFYIVIWCRGRVTRPLKSASNADWIITRGGLSWESNESAWDMSKRYILLYFVNSVLIILALYAVIPLMICPSLLLILLSRRWNIPLTWEVPKIFSDQNTISNGQALCKAVSMIHSSPLIFGPITKCLRHVVWDLETF